MAFAVGGPEYDGNGEFIRHQLKCSGADCATTMLGYVQGEVKRAVFAASECHVLPTHSESFGISIVESLASACPVLTTKAAPWPDLERYDCGWRTEVGAEQTAEGLRKALSLPGDELAAMGERGLKLVREHYTWERTIEQIADYYRWVATGNNPPACVAHEDCE